MNIYLILCYNKTNNLRILKSIQQLWNIPRFLELKTCFNSKNVTVSDPALNMTKEIQVSLTQLNMTVKVRSPFCCPNLTFIACTITVQKPKHALYPKNSLLLIQESNSKIKTKGTGTVSHGIESGGVLHTRLHPHRQLCGHAPPPLPHHHHP